MIDLRIGDCLDVMRGIQNESIDMILCDLPYGTTSCSWDTVIPFDKLWEQYMRITKTHSAIVLTASQPFTSALVMSNAKLFKHEWIWQKNRGSNFANLKTNPFKEHESVLVFCKGMLRFYPIKQERSNAGKLRAKYDFKDSGGGEAVGIVNGSGNRITIDANLRAPSSIQKFNTEVGLHPTQKPVALMEYFIRTYTREGDLVLDNCMGSGSTGVACLNTNRKFIGIESNEKYFNIAKDRLHEFTNTEEFKEAA